MAVYSKILEAILILFILISNSLKIQSTPIKTLQSLSAEYNQARLPALEFFGRHRIERSRKLKTNNESKPEANGTKNRIPIKLYSNNSNVDVIAEVKDTSDQREVLIRWKNHRKHTTSTTHKPKLKRSKPPKLKKVPIITTSVTTTRAPTTTRKQNPAIRKIITTWKDEAKLEEIPYQSNENYVPVSNMKIVDINNIKNALDVILNQNSSNKVEDIPSNKIVSYKKPTQGVHVFSNEINFVDDNISIQDSLEINLPSPRPEITFIGKPKPNQGMYFGETNTIRPIIEKWPPPTEYEDVFLPINNFESNNDSDDADPAVASYTDRIVIRPNEDLGIPEDCPTIYLTLNNSIKAQGKEACPDLNIAVNTNVLNKNVMVQESVEEEDESGIGAFGVPFIDNLSTESLYDGIESESSETGVESLNGNKNTDTLDAGASGETNSLAAPEFNLQILRPSRPQRPNRNKKNKKKNKDKNEAEQSSTNDWLEPATTIMSWLSAFNPLHFGVFSMFLAPIALLLAGSSGVAALVAPWALPYARQAPKVVHVYRPSWKWDPHHHSWSAWRRRWPNEPRYSKEDLLDSPQNSYQSMSDKWTNWISEKGKNAINFLKEAHENFLKIRNRKHSRKKRSRFKKK